MKGSKISFRFISALMMILGSLFYTLQAQDKDVWTEIYLDNAGYEDDHYPMSNIYDGDTETCGVASIVFFRIPKYEKTAVNIFPGNGKSEALFNEYSRPKEIKFTLLVGAHAPGLVTEVSTVYMGLQFNENKTVQLADSLGYQSFELNLPQEELQNFRKQAMLEFRDTFNLEVTDSCIVLKVEITAEYPGAVHNEVCISDIFLANLYASPGMPEGAGIIDAYVNEEQNKLFIDTKLSGKIEIFSDTSSVFSIIELSENKKWATVISMPAEVCGRAETTYLLFDLVNRELVNSKIEAVTGNDISGGLIYFGQDISGMPCLIYNDQRGLDGMIYLK